MVTVSLHVRSVPRHRVIHLRRRAAASARGRKATPSPATRRLAAAEEGKRRRQEKIWPRDHSHREDEVDHALLPSGAELLLPGLLKDAAGKK